MVHKRDDGRPSIGKAVEGGKIRFLSVSQVKKFDPSQDGGCPARWAFEKMFGKKEEKTKAQLLGNQFAKEAESYLKTGQNVLGPVMQAGKHLLPRWGSDIEVEQNVGDIVKALALRDTYLKTGVDVFRDEGQRFARLTALGIPFTGPFDYRHRRGEYVDEGGILRREAEGLIVCEIGDHKTVGRIHDHTTRNGKLLYGRAKTVEQISWDAQMLGYGEATANTYPDLTHIRLSHNYYQRENGYIAEKRTILLSVAEIRERWRSRVVPIVAQMVEAARATRIEDVPKNLASCRAFNRDCEHASYCPRPNMTFQDLMPRGESPMSESDSLFANLRREGTAPPAASVVAAPAVAPVASAIAPAAPSASLFSTQGVPAATPPAPPPPPPLSQDQYDEEKERAKAAFLAQHQAGSGAVSLGYCSRCGTALVPENTSKLKSGDLKHVRCPAETAPPVPAIAAAPALPPPVPPVVALPQTVPHVGAVNPPDAPPSDLIQDAAPLSPEVVATLTDPELRKRVEEHAAAAQAAQSAAAPGKEKTSGRCPGGGQRVQFTQEDLLRFVNQKSKKREKACLSCGRMVAVKTLDDGSGGDLAGHLIEPKEKSAASTAPPATSTLPPPPPPIPAPAAGAPPPLPPGVPPLPAAAVSVPPLPPAAPLPSYRAPDALPGQTAMAPVVPSVPSPIVVDVAVGAPMTVAWPAGIYLFVDVVFERGDAPKSLDDYVQNLVDLVAQQHRLPDLRWAPDGHELSFGRWRGALALACRANPLLAGAYLLRGVAESEFKQVVLEAFTPLCTIVVRGSGR